MKELISVLMPVYNREKFLERSINSILKQTHKTFDFIIFDDGSTDNSVKIIKKYEKVDERIRVILGNKNYGVGNARNILLENCNTQYACWQDSDDISHQSRLEMQLNYVDANTLVFTKWKHLNTGKLGNTLGFATLMFPVDKNVKFKTEMQFGGEDWDFVTSMRKKVLKEHELIHGLYSIDFHDNRIGTWKRKICKDWGGKFNKEDIDNLTYSEAIKKYESKINNE